MSIIDDLQTLAAGFAPQVVMETTPQSRQDPIKQTASERGKKSRYTLAMEMEEKRMTAPSNRVASPLPRIRLKCLCVCLRGNVRSVALAYLIKLIYKHEAIAIGCGEATTETMEMLYKWADKVIFLDRTLLSSQGFGGYVLDVGPDIWFDPFHHELQHKILKKIGSLNL